MKAFTTGNSSFVLRLLAVLSLEVCSLPRAHYGQEQGVLCFVPSSSNLPHTFRMSAQVYVSHQLRLWGPFCLCRSRWGPLGTSLVAENPSEVSIPWPLFLWLFWHYFLLAQSVRICCSVHAGPRVLYSWSWLVGWTTPWECVWDCLAYLSFTHVSDPQLYSGIITGQMGWVTSGVAYSTRSQTLRGLGWGTKKEDFMSLGCWLKSFLLKWSWQGVFGSCGLLVWTAYGSVPVAEDIFWGGGNVLTCQTYDLHAEFWHCALLKMCVWLVPWGNNLILGRG